MIRPRAAPSSGIHWGQPVASAAAWRLAMSGFQLRGILAGSQPDGALLVAASARRTGDGEQSRRSEPTTNQTGRKMPPPPDVAPHFRRWAGRRAMAGSRRPPRKS